MKTNNRGANCILSTVLCIKDVINGGKDITELPTFNHSACDHVQNNRGDWPLSKSHLVDTPILGNTVKPVCNDHLYDKFYYP